MIFVPKKIISGVLYRQQVWGKRNEKNEMDFAEFSGIIHFSDSPNPKYCPNIAAWCVFTES